MLSTTNILIVVFFFGLYLFWTGSFISPTDDIEKAISKDRFENSGPIEKICRKIQRVIYPYVNLSERQDALIRSYLITEKKDISAKDFVTYNYAQTIFIIIGGILVGLVTGSFILALPFFFLSYVNYRQEEKKISKKFETTRHEVEKDVSKFCSIISGKLKSTNNVENIIKSFLPVANDSMRLQLEVTLADIRTGDVHTALTRLERRVVSRKLSDITRGLKAVANGDDQKNYFELKESEFIKEHQSLLEKEIEDRASKLLPVQIAIVVMFVICVIYPFGVTVLKEAGSLFGAL